MMTGRLYIDGKDAYEQWGVYVTKDGWNELIAFPPLKDVDTNDWQEEDGVEADLSDPKLNTKEVQLQVAYGGVFNRFMEFLNLLADGAYHEFNGEYIGRTFKLRLTQMPNLSAAQAIGTASLKFNNDFPLDGYKYKEPSSSVMQVEDYLLDGVPFTKYGCRILKGTLSEILKHAKVKTNLVRNITTQDGAEYDDETVTFSSKEVKVYCLMRAETITELWRNYDALLYDLIRPNERELEVAAIEQTFPFYYKSCQVTNFFPDGKIWLEFTLTICFTGDFRIDTEDMVLASEDGELIFTEDDQYAIEMLPGKFSLPTARLVNNRTTLRLTGNGAFRFND
jgi:hypothetical protein